jgi:GNAT superfamily N-acetyltransferase
MQILAYRWGVIAMLLLPIPLQPSRRHDQKFAVQRLNESLRAALVAHFLALPMRDRSLRFCASLAPELIKAYVDRIDFDHDAVFGVHDHRHVLVGVAHLAFTEDLAEVALSVLPAHRDRGVGSALFEGAVAHARNRRVPRLFMQFLSGNAPIMHIAQKFGMGTVTRAGVAEAYLELQPDSLATIAVAAGEPVEFTPAGSYRSLQ